MTELVAADRGRERITRLLVIEIFFVFFLGWMIAPLLPRLASNLGTSVERAGVLIPAYAIPYGCICLLVGPVADRFGRGRVLRLLLIPTVLLPALSASAHSIGQLIAWRVVTGLALGGIAPIALALVAEMYPYAERGRPVGWIFGAIAGGMALGATMGPWLEPWIGWRGLFLLVSAINIFAGIALSLTLRTRKDVVGSSLRPAAVVGNYVALIGTRRGATVYAYVFLNGAFHSGIFSWLGVYFTSRYHLGSTQLGFAMLGYGIPGFLLGPIVGRYADRFGRRWLIRTGLVMAAICAFVLTRHLPLFGATLTITALSFGFDLSHPLFSGIVSALDPVRTAQAMALNTFAVFVGLGVGSIVFGALYAAYAMNGALIIFGIFQLALATATLVLFDASWR
jgi:predicted MFS family arabinose efflux permease